MQVQFQPSHFVNLLVCTQTIRAERLIFIGLEGIMQIENLCETCEKFNNLFVSDKICKVPNEIKWVFESITVSSGCSYDAIKKTRNFKINYGITECSNYVKK